MKCRILNIYIYMYIHIAIFSFSFNSILRPQVYALKKGYNDLRTESQASIYLRFPPLCFWLRISPSSDMKKIRRNRLRLVYFTPVCTGAQLWGGEGWGRAPSCFNSLAKDRSLIEALHILHLAVYYLILPITNIPAPPLKFTRLRP